MWQKDPLDTCNVLTSGSQPGCRGPLRCHLRYSGGPRANAFFNISLKILFSECYQTIKQIAMGSPLGAANFICLPSGRRKPKMVGKHWC